MPVTYKRKAAFLSALVAVLAVIYVLILFLDRDVRRSDVFAWLDPDLIIMADRIEITGPEGIFTLNRRNAVWVLDAGHIEVPVRQSRVEDLFTLLSGRAVYPIRASSAEAAERLGLAERNAHRIRIHGGAGLPLLDLLVGVEDVLGREVYLRLSDRNQIHSGGGDFSFFTNLSPEAWFDLRLFPPFNADIVQQADIVLSGEEVFSLRRSGSGWIILGENVFIDAIRVETWLRSVIEAQGEGFALDAPEYAEGSITLRLGDGTTRTIMASPAYEQGIRLVTVGGSSLVYVLSDLSFNRIFRDKAHFVRD
jgi:hypothetical protein